MADEPLAELIELIGGADEDSPAIQYVRTLNLSVSEDALVLAAAVIEAELIKPHNDEIRSEMLQVLNDSGWSWDPQTGKLSPVTRPSGIGIRPPGPG